MAVRGSVGEDSGGRRRDGLRVSPVSSFSAHNLDVTPEPRDESQLKHSVVGLTVLNADFKHVKAPVGTVRYHPLTEYKGEVSAVPFRLDSDSWEARSPATCTPSSPFTSTPLHRPSPSIRSERKKSNKNSII
ncbi:hypothetical protein EVAR_20731_1 [Eumeta japonica]|uniref:Uncharacterized protein n=1 Tax=Eumeta variegata TaxID=151549 RepID=A0A4C1V8Y2_EUMVA|nr:hypothetical protein EVAR_20731_1 [Eumeta japonica]